MKKNQPSPSPHSSVQEFIKHYEETAKQSSTGNDPQTTGVSRSKKSISIPQKEDEKALLLEEDVISVDAEHTHTFVMTNSSTQSLRDKATKSEPQETVVYTTTASQRMIHSLSEKEITRLIAYDPWLKAYQKDISYWCGEVFRKKNILQEKVEQIQQDPSLGKELLWQFAECPERIHKLAGVNICGIKNKTRKKAEKNLVLLDGIIGCYVEAVKVARENLLQFPQKELKRYEKLVGDKTLSHILQSTHYAEREKVFFPNTAVIDMVQEDSTVKRCQARIRYWSHIVFGKSNIVQEKIQDMLEDPYTGIEFIQQLTGNTKSFHKLSGINICGFKNKARRHAETGLSELINAVDNFVAAIKQAKKDIFCNYEAQQEYREPFVELAKNLHTQQNLSRSSECLLASTPHKISETSRQAQERIQNIQSRKTSGKKTLALAS